MDAAKEEVSGAQTTTGEAAEPDPDLDQFVQKWSLEKEQVVEFIHGLDSDTRQAVLAEFNPPPDTRSVAARLRVFALNKAARQRRKSAKSQPRQGPQPAARGARSKGTVSAKPGPIGARPALSRSRADGPPGLQTVLSSSTAAEGEAPESEAPELEPVEPSSASATAAVTDFVQKWGLGRSSEDMLHMLQKGVLEKVLANFAPEGDIRNMNGKLQAYVQREISRSKPASKANPVVRSFCRRVGLDSRSEALLQSLSPQQLHIVFRDFKPPLGSDNANGKLNAFVRLFKRSAPSYSLLLDDGRRGRAKSVGSRRVSSKSGRLARRSVGARSRDDSRQNGARYSSAAESKLADEEAHEADEADETDESADSPLKLFEAKWGLDKDARQALRELPQDLLDEVLSEFEPPVDTSNMSGRLRAFVRRKVASTGVASQKIPRQPILRQKRSAIGEPMWPRGVPQQSASPTRPPPGLASGK